MGSSVGNEEGCSTEEIIMTQEEIIEVARKTKPSTLPPDNRDGSMERLKVIKKWNEEICRACNCSEQRARTAIVKVLRNE